MEELGETAFRPLNVRLRRFVHVLAFLALLAAVGCLSLYTVMRGSAESHFLPLRQLTWAALSFLVLFCCFLFPFKDCRWIALCFVAAVYLLLLFLPFLGIKINGMRGWFHFGGLCIQPTELAKPAFILAFAFLWEKCRNQGGNQRFLWALALLFALLLPVSLQPDWGAVLLFCITFTILIYALDGNWKCLLPFLLAGIAAAIAVIAKYPYVRMRFLGFLGMAGENAKFGVNYQAFKMRECLEHGGWFGILFGGTDPLVPVPYRYNDSMFACVGETLGFCGVVPLILICLAWMARCCLLAVRSHKYAPVFIGGGAMLSVQAFVHLAVNLGLMPTTGITLPLMSYGGSSMMSTVLIVGIVERYALEDSSNL